MGVVDSGMAKSGGYCPTFDIRVALFVKIRFFIRNRSNRPGISDSDEFFLVALNLIARQLVLNDWFWRQLTLDKGINTGISGR
jgi:hypothetical protein